VAVHRVLMNQKLVAEVIGKVQDICNGGIDVRRQ
jgi:hypothetical protein